MAENIPLQKKEERKEIFTILNEINAVANELVEN